MNYYGFDLIYLIGIFLNIAIPLYILFRLVYFCRLIQENNAMLKELLARGSKKQEVVEILEKHQGKKVIEEQ